MAFQTLNGYDVEHASQLLVYENLIPEIQHINGKGVTDKYTKSDDIESVTYIDIMRVLPYPPRFRKVGGTNNGAFHNARNVGGYNNAPQSTHYTIPVDLYYDEGVPITSVQTYSNPVDLQRVVMAQIVKTAGLSINVITYAKQIEGFFRIGDNFAIGKNVTKATIASTDISASEIAASIVNYDGTATNATSAFLSANALLNDGIPELGALHVPADERQAFITSGFDTKMKAQYQQNASESATRILATGFINPFTNAEGKRINTSTGLLGMYDGVDMFLFNKSIRKFVYVALGVYPSASDVTYASERGYLDQIDAIIVYGAGTCRGIVGPTVEANPNTYFGGVYILPKMKVGVEVLHGASIKLVINAGAALANAWTATEIVALIKAITFTPIDGSVVTASYAVAGFNDGTTN